MVLRDERMMMGIDIVSTLPGTSNYSVVPLTHTEESIFLLSHVLRNKAMTTFLERFFSGTVPWKVGESWSS